MSLSVRTRFAPSPTGYLHVGGVRTALFAWLVAKQSGGKFILRIEDTDKKRKVEGADQHIIDSLSWLGLNPDEKPIYQSDRVESGIYKKWAEELIKNGRAYADPYTPEEVQKFRTQAQAEKKPFLYRNRRPENPPIWNGSQPLRFKSDPKAYSKNDAVMGKLTTGSEIVDDFILIKSDGFPTYNFAHIVDDIEMKISHVIRGQEFLSSLPNYLNLYEALDEKPPIFATVPHILNEHGNKKLSKRDGAKDILDYQSDGYLPEAMVNFLATLGWNDGSEQEVFFITELIKKFDLTRIQKSGAHFDERRLDWISGQHVRKLNLDDLSSHARTFWPPSAKEADSGYKQRVLSILQDRIKHFSELPELSEYFFRDLPINPKLITNDKKLKKIDKLELIKWLELTNKRFSSMPENDWNSDNLQNILNELLGDTGQKPAMLFSLIRIAITQSPSSPGLAETLEVLGKEKSTKRIREQIEALD